MTPPRIMRKVLVTGATGFVGRALCAALVRRGASVEGIARRSAPGPWTALHRVDLGEQTPPAGAFEGVDTVFHLAAKVHAVDELDQREADYEQANVEATRAVLRAAREAGAGRLVHFSSVKAMGEGGPECLDETAVPRPESAYGRSKLAAEDLVAAASGPALGTVNLRLPLVYGPGCKGNLASMLAAVAAGRFPPLPDTGNRRSMVHVDNVVAAALAAAVHPAASGKLFIVTDERPYSTAQLVAAMYAALGKRPPRWSIPFPVLRAAARLGDWGERLLRRRLPLDSDRLEKLLGSACYSSMRLQRELGVVPAKGLEEGVREMCEQLGAARSRDAVGGTS